LTSFNKGDTKQSSTDKPVALGFQIKLEFGNVGFLRREEKSEDLEKKPTYDTRSSNQTWATLVEGKCSHHWAIPAPRSFCLKADLFVCR